MHHVRAEVRERARLARLPAARARRRIRARVRVGRPGDEVRLELGHRHRVAEQAGGLPERRVGVVVVAKRAALASWRRQRGALRGLGWCFIFLVNLLPV